MSEQNLESVGVFDAKYRTFLEMVTQLRPSLHRYCARMTGSVLDGEDVVQEALFEAYRKLDQFDDSRPLKPWLFRIAHNRCIDFLRKRNVREEAETAATEPDTVPPLDPASLKLGPAIEHLVSNLPPKERGCVLLKDVFDYSLDEIAELVESTVGGVKAALARGRAKLANMPVPERRKGTDGELSRLLRLYVERFNRRDWDGVRDLIRADARLLVANGFAGRLSDSSYFGNYDRWSVPWRMAVGEVDGETVILVLKRDGELWAPIAPIRFQLADGRITHIADYVHCPWLLDAAGSVTHRESLPN